MLDKKQLLDSLEHNELYATALSLLKTEDEKNAVKNYISQIFNELTTQEIKEENHDSKLLKQ
jgi:hypothetical protein